ncbi:helix-turn-helix domain-containing protein [Gordonia sp. HS-NH1]|uniref:helix-turn-helix domain-containing protein n=1 Tax=Gordonia sp. HS-NH1 TaxID=1435068 RepID=UPI001E51DDD1|nr:helix-turn-helix transcriptional regulator [Gordonia sp. HS-NH1]
MSAVVHVAPAALLAIDDDDLECLAAYQGAASAAFSRDAWSDIAIAHHAAVRRAAETIVEDAIRVTADDFDIGAEVPSEVHPPPLAGPAVNLQIENCLTSRETEVMRLIAQGLSNAEIADRLFIGIETVKSHVKKVLRKIGAVNRSEAISLYLDKG